MIFPIFHMQHGYNPLIIASYNGHIDVVRLLLQNKADPNIRNEVLLYWNIHDEQ